MKQQLEALYARVPLGMRLGLDAMREACARAGSPERGFPAVHIAGTNGKGSTCAMLESAARASGLRTGLYTSPHLCRFAERIRVDGAPIDDATLVGALDEALRSDISFFETATLAAFLAFRNAKVDLAIIEVGIGGRLDATNVLPTETIRASAITRIAYDHQDKLGDTLAQIAREKAGIAREGVPLIHGPLPVDAVIAIRSEAAKAGAPLVEAAPYEGALGLGGEHQRINAGVAAELARRLGLGADTIARGLAIATWPGRLERITTKGGTWILDGAHNPDGAQALAAALKAERIGAVIFGALADKQWKAMLAHVADIDAPRFYVAPGGRAPASPAELAAAHSGTSMTSLGAALEAARSCARELPVVICGSLYLVGEARAELLGLPRDPVVAL